jgi:hypothetical protein
MTKVIYSYKSIFLYSRAYQLIGFLCLFFSLEYAGELRISYIKKIKPHVLSDLYKKKNKTQHTTQTKKGEIPLLCPSKLHNCSSSKVRVNRPEILGLMASKSHLFLCLHSDQAPKMIDDAIVQALSCDSRGSLIALPLPILKGRNSRLGGQVLEVDVKDLPT